MKTLHSIMGHFVRCDETEAKILVLNDNLEHWPKPKLHLSNDNLFIPMNFVAFHMQNTSNHCKRSGRMTTGLFEVIIKRRL